jgi:hypothetical protein
MEPRRRESLGEDVNQLISGGDEFNLEILAKHSFSDEMKINLNVLHSSMENGIRSNC